LLKRELSVEEFRILYRDIDAFLDFTSKKTGEIGGNLSNILLAQDYQDLTGQVIKKVIDLVNEVESKLVELVKMASHVENITGIVNDASFSETDIKKIEKVGTECEGPIMRAEARSDVVNSQDEVDDLLSSLGF
jgi:chemotaxis protein CheZ